MPSNNVFVFASTRIEKVDIYDAAGRLAATVAPNHTEASLLLPGHGFYVCRVLTADGSVSIRKIAL